MAAVYAGRMTLPLSFDTILFDLDGTLVDTADDLTASLNHALQALGRPAVAPASVRGMVGHGARKLLERGLSATGGMTPELVDEGVSGFLDYYRDHIADFSRPFPGADTALDQLAARGFRLGVCTNKPESLARQLLACLGWADRFAAVRGSDSQPWRKPDPRHLTATLADAGGKACIFVGDSRTDADTAVAAGIPFILVSFGYSIEPLDQLQADYRIDDFAELAAAVDTIQSRFTASGYQPVA